MLNLIAPEIFIEPCIHNLLAGFKKQDVMYNADAQIKNWRSDYSKL